MVCHRQRAKKEGAAKRLLVADLLPSGARKEGVAKHPKADNLQTVVARKEGVAELL